MGRYTSLAHKVRSRTPPQTDEAKTNKLAEVVPSSQVPTATSPADKHDYDITTYDINDFVTRCIHDLAEDVCAVCNGYVRWLIEDEKRLQAACRDPEEARRYYRRLVEGK
jgi:hypothetical protein